MESPIILIGTHRSGTTWLTRILSQHPDVASWMEPRYVWSWGNNYKPNDILNAKDATSKITQHIRRRFKTYLKDHSKSRLVEKTPSNCLRLPFILQVFPQAKIVHLIRDGRSVFSSAKDMLDTGFYRPDKLTSRFSEMLRETPLKEWPAYYPQTYATVKSKLLKTSLPFWGPRPEHWQDWIGQYPQAVILAKQWSALARKASMDGEKIQTSQYHQLRYEDLITHPKETIEKVINFTELSSQPELLNYVQESVNPKRQRIWSDEIDPLTLKEIRPHMEETLIALGYKW